METTQSNLAGLKLLTEKEFLQRVDKSLSQAKEGRTHSADFVQNYMRQEYAL